MKRQLERLLILAAGTTGLLATTAGLALAVVSPNHTEPLRTL